MESMIHVGTKIDKDTSDNLATFVDKVFESGGSTTWTKPPSFTL